MVKYGRSALAILAWLVCARLLHAVTPQPADWVPVRWLWTDGKSLELLGGSPINCLLLKAYTPELLAAAAERGLVTLAVLPADGDVVAGARKALSAKLTG